MNARPPRATPHARAHLLAAAGLLHDVGKIFEPSGLELSTEDLALEALICPTWDGRPTHRHVLWTARVIDRALTNWGGMDRAEFFRVAAYHHRPSNDSLDQWLLQQADHLASGHDRRPVDGDDQKVTGLLSIFPKLATGDPGAHGVDRHLATGSLEFSTERFLPIGPQSADAYRAACRALSAAVEAGLRVPYPDESACVDGLLGLTERLFHAVPSSRYWKERPDVGLFDHSRSVAAFAACLGADTTPGMPREQVTPRFRLLSLTLGGIQDFIFRSVPAVDGTGGGGRGRAKLLRARSFYVSVLSFLAALRILDAVGLPLTNLVFHAGGRSILLLPTGQAHAAAADTALAWVRRWFLEHLAGVIRLRVGELRGLAPDDFRGPTDHAEGFINTYRQLTVAAERGRQGLPSDHLRNADGWTADGWVGTGPGHPVDAAPFTGALRVAGEKLPQAGWIALDSEVGGALASIGDVLGYRVALFDRRPEGGRAFALRLHQHDVAAPLLLVSTHVPVTDETTVHDLQSGLARSEELPQLGAVVTFSHLAHLSTDGNGKPVPHAMLGVFKADVDRLGLLLGYGLPPDQVSFGRLAALSRSLDLFFKGFLDDRVAKAYPRAYSVFSGGDDLLLVGPWYDLVRFARDLRAWFHDHACGHAGISLSAGLVFAKPSTPVRQLAGLADDALEHAKDAGRNRITLAGSTLLWDEFERAWTLHRLMLEARHEAKGRRQDLRPAFVYRLLRYAMSARRVVGTASSDARLSDVKWRAQLNYDVSRNYPAGRPGDSGALSELRKALLQVDHTQAAALHAAATLTLYVLRGER